MMGALKNAFHDVLELRRAIADGGWEEVTDCHYRLTRNDFTDVLREWTEAGADWITGRCPRGDIVTTPLDVPLCSSCDEPLPSDGVCAGCEVIHTDARAAA